MQNPPGYSLSGGTSQAPQFPLENLETVCLRMDSLHNFLEQAINGNTVITKDQTAVISSEIASAIHQIMINGSALVSSRTTTAVDSRNSTAGKLSADGFDSDCEIVELDAVELLAEHMHFCEICGKGFKRDANLRMHMRAHGNQYKTPEALAKPGKDDKTPGKRRFSCPFEGCNRNMRHKKFRPLKSVICVKNHFKRSHCPKMYSCNRCNKKSFSVVSDLKSHLKHCGGEARWKCSCGTSFSRKDKLFGHVGLFEGHMPLVTEDRGGGESKGKGKIGGESEGSCLESGDYERLFGGFGSIEDGFRLEDVLGSSNGCFNGGGMSFW